MKFQSIGFDTDLFLLQKTKQFFVTIFFVPKYKPDFAMSIKDEAVCLKLIFWC